MKIFSVLNGFLFSFFFLVLWSCAEETSVSYIFQESMSNEIAISATIHSFISPARAQLDEKGKGTFEEGDRISFFSDSRLCPWRNYVLTFNKGQWGGCPSWNKIGRAGDTAGFVAYYPAFSTQGKEALFNVFADQSTVENYLGSDLLGANFSAHIPQNVSLHFEHLMSHVTISLYSEDKSFDDEQLDNATVEIRSYLGGTILLPAKKAGAVDKKAVQWVKSYKRGKLFSAILFPQPLSLFRDADGWIKITIGGKSVIYKVPEELNGEKLERLQSGSQLSLRLNLQKKQEGENGTLPAVDNMTITRWVKGIRPPIDTDWQQVTGFNDVDYKMVPWKSGYNWYDINKVKDTRDRQLCWAAVAANMLHWWLDNNVENLKKYKEFNQPITFHNSFDSDIFNYFKKVNLTDGRGGWTDRALNWYLNGFYAMRLSNKAQLDSRGGFFRTVFKDNVLSDNTTISRKTTFDLRIKEMFDKGRAGGVTFNVFRNTPAMHIVTIWGAEFNYKGEVTVLYIVDSDDKDSSPQGLKKMKVEASPTGQTLGVGPYGGKSTLQELHTLDLGVGQWKSYFNTIDVSE